MTDEDYRDRQRFVEIMFCSGKYLSFKPLPLSYAPIEAIMYELRVLKIGGGMGEDGKFLA